MCYIWLTVYDMLCAVCGVGLCVNGLNENPREPRWLPGVRPVYLAGSLVVDVNQLGKMVQGLLLGPTLVLHLHKQHIDDSG